MSDMEAGFSNSDAVDDAPADVHPDVAEPFHPEPGFSNAMAVVAVEGQTVKAEAVSTDAEADADAEPRPAKKAAAKRSAAKKKG